MHFFGRFCTKKDDIGSDEVVLCTNTGRIVRQSLNDIPVQGRYAKGVFIQRLDEAAKEEIAALTIPEAGEQGSSR
jgi:DNA gyrase/topoisomerase IV subunit A